MLIVGKANALVEVPVAAVAEYQYAAFHFMDPDMVEALRTCFDTIWRDAEAFPLIRQGRLNEHLYTKLKDSFKAPDR